METSLRTLLSTNLSLTVAFFQELDDFFTARRWYKEALVSNTKDLDLLLSTWDLVRRYQDLSWEPEITSLLVAGLR